MVLDLQQMAAEVSNYPISIPMGAYLYRLAQGKGHFRPWTVRLSCMQVGPISTIRLVLPCIQRQHQYLSVNLQILSVTILLTFVELTIAGT